MANTNPLKDIQIPKDKLLLQILSPEGTIYDELVDEVNVPTPNGEIGILPEHVSLATKLAQGELRVKKGSQEQTIVIFGGFLEVHSNKVVVLSDYAVRAENIEIARMEEAKKRAEDVIKNKQENVDFILAEKELQKSILTLKSAEKIRRRNRS